MKHCKKCNTTKELSEFRNKSNSKDGLDIYCRSCQKEYDRNRHPHRYLIAKDKCEMCGIQNNCVDTVKNKQFKLAVHHKDGNHSNNDLSNLQCLCNSCHAKIHLKERYKNNQ